VDALAEKILGAADFAAPGRNASTEPGSARSARDRIRHLPLERRARPSRPR
jgi:hypothetical protein